MEFIDIWGYVASGIIILSFLIKNNLTLLRAINLLGCAMFIYYGFVKNSHPIIITNTFITGIQVYYLFIAKKTKE